VLQLVSMLASWLVSTPSNGEAKCKPESGYSRNRHLF